MKRTVILVAGCCLFGIVVGAAPPVLVVAPLSNATGNEDYQPLETVLQDLLVTALSRSDSVAVVDRAKLNRLLRERKLALDGRSELRTAARAGKLIGANIVVLGSFTLVDGRLRVDSRAVEVETSVIRAAEQLSASPSALLQIGEQLGAGLLKKLQFQAARVAPLPPDPNPSASVHFLRGLGLYYSGQRDEAIAEFVRCLQLDPKHADARFWKARSYVAEKEWTHARIELRRFLADVPAHEQAIEVKKMLAVCDRNLSAEQKAFFESLDDSASQNPEPPHP
jgi:TolB-like protein